jgi:hypothetical protein
MRVIVRTEKHNADNPAIDYIHARCSVPALTRMLGKPCDIAGLIQVLAALLTRGLTSLDGRACAASCEAVRLCR